MKEVKRIDFTKKSFEANGKKYKWDGRLSLSRWTEFENLQTKLGFGKDFEAIHRNLKLAVDMGNKGKGIEAWNIIFNIISGVGDKLENRLDTALHIAALFINRSDEDKTICDTTIFEEKIEDWKVEGYDAMDFFSLAANLVKGFVEALQETSQNTLTKAAATETVTDKSKLSETAK